MSKLTNYLMAIALVALLAACGKNNSNPETAGGGKTPEANPQKRGDNFTPNHLKIHSAVGVFKEQPSFSVNPLFTFVITADYQAQANYEIDECIFDTCVKNSIRIMCLNKSVCEVLTLRGDNQYRPENTQSVKIEESSTTQKKTVEILHYSKITKLGSGHKFSMRAFDASGNRSETLNISRP